MKVDLHLHTRHSDGNWTPEQLVARAIELKLKHIAITDHDTTAGIDAAVSFAGTRLEVIPAIEINTIWRQPGLPDEDIHVLGYFIDKDSPALKAILARQQEARTRLVEDTITALAPLGVNLTFAMVKECAADGSIGRPHITQAIVKAGGASNVNEAYEKFMVRGSPHFIARASVSAGEAVAAIIESGGVASVAHPGRSRKVEQIILELKAYGLKAVEAYHRKHSLSVVQHYIRFANRHGLIVTGGSDCHGPFGDYPASIGSISVPYEVVERLRAVRLSAQI